MKNLVSFFLHLIGPRRRGPKESSFVVIKSDIPEIIQEGSTISSLAGGEPGKSVEEECCVCLWRLTEGDETRRLPCFHMFHKVCIDRWLNLCRKTCPICRFSVEGETSLKREELTEEMVIWFSSFHVAGF